MSVGQTIILWGIITLAVTRAVFAPHKIGRTTTWTVNDTAAEIVASVCTIAAVVYLTH